MAQPHLPVVLIFNKQGVIVVFELENMAKSISALLIAVIDAGFDLAIVQEINIVAEIFPKRQFGIAPDRRPRVKRRRADVILGFDEVSRQAGADG
jgi:hypothetical protein